MKQTLIRIIALTAVGATLGGAFLLTGQEEPNEEPSKQ